MIQTTDIILHFLIGFAVSFVGSLPLGTVNLAVIQTTINVNFRAAIYLALGATIIELIYSAIAIKFIAVLMHNTYVEMIIHAISIPVFIVLGFMYFRKEDSMEMKEQKKMRSFYNGIFIGLINPLQIPFWIAWGSILLSNDWIVNEPFLLDIFIVGICVGTLIVLILLALVSKKIISRINIQTKMVNKVIGIILFVLAAYEIFRLSYHFFK